MLCDDAECLAGPLVFQENPTAAEGFLRIRILKRLVDVPQLASPNVGICGLVSDRIPDETTILTFRHLMEKYELRE